jgi:hypothetical protein
MDFANINPDESEIPPSLSKPASRLPLKECIGLQGKHAGAPVHFENIKSKDMYGRV